jgi:transposase InsO family protein
MSELLKKLYYDPQFGFSAAAVYRAAKAIDPQVTQAKVKEFIKNQSAEQVHAQVKAPKAFYPIKAGKIDHIWQADLADISRDAHTNSGMNWLLCVIDIFTRYSWVIPLKNKEAKTVTAAMQSLLENPNERRNTKENTIEHKKPEIIMSDNDSAFTSRVYKKFMDDSNIELSFTDVDDLSRHHKLGVIDAFIKRLREIIEKYKTAFQTERFIDKIPELNWNMNHRAHSALGGSSPANPNFAAAIALIKDKEDKAAKYLKSFPIGSTVRYVLNRGLFDKGSKPKWSVPHKVVSQEGRNYTLDNGRSFMYYYLNDTTNSGEAPLNAVVNAVVNAGMNAAPPHLPKKQRLALRKEGVSDSNIVRTLRERKPSNQLLTAHGERVIF